MRLVSSFAFALVLTSLACGGSPPPPATSPEVPADAAAPSLVVLGPAPAMDGGAVTSTTPASTPEPAAHPAAPSFDSMTKEQKIEHMKTVVTPRLGKVFREADEKHYKDFSCTTCHGAKKEDPHKFLPKLTLSGGGFEKLTKAKPAVMKFMGEKVVPEMAAAMNEKPYDPATKQGFGCGGCHAVN